MRLVFIASNQIYKNPKTHYRIFPADHIAKAIDENPACVRSAIPTAWVIVQTTYPNAGARKTVQGHLRSAGAISAPQADPSAT